MKTLLLAVLFSVTAVAPAAAQDRPAEPKVGQPVYDSEGKRLADVYHVTAAGSAQILMEGRVITIPASTLSKVNNRLTTSLSRDEVRKRR